MERRELHSLAQQCLRQACRADVELPIAGVFAEVALLLLNGARQLDRQRGRFVVIDGERKDRTRTFDERA
jgi:hypothetical protein